MTLIPIVFGASEGSKVFQVDWAYLLIGFFAALIYSILGYVASDKAFDVKKFLRTLFLAILVALGLDVAGVTADVYTAMTGPLAILVWLLKLLDSGKRMTKSK